MENPIIFLSRVFFKRKKSFKKRKTFSVASFIEEVARSDGGVSEINDFLIAPRRSISNGSDFFHGFDSSIHVFFRRESADAHTDGSMNIECADDLVYFRSAL